MLPEDIEQELLYKCVSIPGWLNLTQGIFSRKYRNEVSSLDDAVIATHDVALPLYGQSTVYALANGYTVLCTYVGLTATKWSLFESYDRHKCRSQATAWAEFARGRWVLETPQQPGQYAVRDLDLGKRGFRELRIVHGRLRDVTGGPVRPGHVSEWLGYWWLPRLPTMPDSF